MHQPSLPPVVPLLGTAVFAQGTSEFMVAGLVPDIASEMSVSIPAAGLLTSAFAVGMAVGAPLMALLAMRWPRRLALAAFLVAFVLAHVVAALTGSFEVLVATRVVGALANAGFLAVGLATVTSIVPADAKGRALAVLLAGTTIACVAGVPGGAVLGGLWGWRSAFWAVALLCIPALVAVLTSVPRDHAGTTPPSARGELRALRRPQLLVVLLLGALVNGATFCSFTFLAPVLTDVSGIAAGWVPAMLALFGGGAFLGVRLAARWSDTRPGPVLALGGTVLAVGWAAFALTAGNAVAAVVLVPLMGTLAFAVGGTLIARVLYAASGAPNLAGSFATASLNIGAAVGPWIGGIVIGAGLDLSSPLWVSAALVAAALAIVVLERAAGPWVTPRTSCP
ncbi:DHA1 family chloramphenicol resistance protein-like MFS transporter [Pseudonocardia cypriaca]|uniref:DHA1 family chloramphenicol resistance protein-like MFS transporter n=1 Tax=Pseudonocardia cypriaca TaxID=882449 RepID=A0A543FRB2_9PSEU|nr:DHA1 family chloramphenicol resistance protein-like MFS transporter [Pseudonocardia cypriaca]